MSKQKFLVRFIDRFGHQSNIHVFADSKMQAKTITETDGVGFENNKRVFAKTIISVESLDVLTVAQLIRQLQALGIEAQDLPVVRGDADWGFVSIKTGAEIVTCEGKEGERYGFTTEYHTPEELVFKAVKLS